MNEALRLRSATDEERTRGAARRDARVRWLMLCLILLAFARVTWRLDAKSLWWDESLSLQRAESDWPSLLTGRLVMTDGVNQEPTTDQHPFAFFVALGILVRLAGTSEFVLRYPAAAGATLLVPLAWVLARRLARHKALPPSTPQWAAGLAALSPFYLWYGQEARMYTLVPALALCSIYLLLRWTRATSGAGRARYLLAYAGVTALLLATHYLSVLILPVHGIIILQRVAQGPRRWLALGGGALSGAGLAAASAAFLIRMGPAQASNFSTLSLRVLVPDLVNAFSLGLSVNIAQVKWLDYLVATLAALGLLWSLRPGQRPPGSAWALPLFLVVPVVGLLVMQQLRPVYMNARHLSLISGGFLLAAGAGMAWLWQERRWMGIAAGLVVVAGMAYSTVNYHTVPAYAKDDFRALSRYLRAEIQAGDLILLQPSEMWRLYRYYLPLEGARVAGGAAGTGNRLPSGAVQYRGVPFVSGGAADTTSQIESLADESRRIWWVSSGMVPINPLQEPVADWLDAHFFRARDASFASPNSFLRLTLFLRRPPFSATKRTTIPRPLEVDFGSQVRLAGYDIGEPWQAGGAVPVTLYWQAREPMQRRYKYILRLTRRGADGSWQTVSLTEREPYDGTTPTTAWQHGQTVTEYSQVSGPPPTAVGPEAYRLTVAVYDGETGQKLTASAAGHEVDQNDQSVVLPYVH